MTRPRSRRRSHQTLTVARMSGMGTELVGAIVMMAVLGWLLDRWLGTEPWLTIGGLGFGLVVGMYRFFRTAITATRVTRDRSDEPGTGDAGG